MVEIQPRLVGECVILVGETEITPATPHLFAVLLALVLEGDPWTRTALQDLLFPGVAGSSHRLRQLLYRLRTSGVEIEEKDGPIRLRNRVGDPLGGADGSTGRHGAGSLRVLAHYSPRLSAPYLDWLESAREALQRRLYDREIATLRAARERNDWRVAAEIAASLAQLDPMSEELAATAAEAHAMLGRRDAALGVIDRFVRESERDASAWPSLQRLRARIVAARPQHRDGTLRGRSECLAMLADQWESAVTGSGGRACVIFGPAGMGKTRVGETFAAAVRLKAGKVMTYRCDEQNRGSPLALFALIVRDLRQMRGSIGAEPALRAALEDLAPESATIPTPVAAVDARREELRRAIVDLFEAVTSEQPVLLVIDDAHLLDDPSRAVVRSIAADTNGARMLIVLLCRPRPDDRKLVSTAGRMSVYTLPALNDDDSRALIREVSADREPSPAQVDWAVAQAAGNAFYLHALARNPGEGASLPAHVRSLAHTSHHALSHEARTVLETCLLLDTLASIGRVSRASAMSDREMLAALRELEEADLIRHDGNVLAGPHAIIRDALVELIPTTTSMLLNRRIAEMLSEECAVPSQARIVAWTAVNCWLAAGDSASAVELALKVARDTEAVGEPEAGAVLLNSIPRENLAPRVQRHLLDQISRLARDGKCPGLVRDSLKERRALAMRTDECSDTIADLTLKIVVSEAHNRLENTPNLRSILVDGSISFALRHEARLRLLVEADNHYDRCLAEEAFNSSVPSEGSDQSGEDICRRANLIFHTSFGTVATALQLVEALLIDFPEATIEPVARQARSYAILALLRLGCYDRVASLAKADWKLNDRTGNLHFAEHLGTVAADALIAAGRLREASEITTAIDRCFEGRGLSEEAHPLMYYLNAAMLAMAAGELERAGTMLQMGREVHGGNLIPRSESALTAYVCRCQRLSGSPPSRRAIGELAALHEAGGRHCSQDTVVEELWHYHRGQGDDAAATHLLRKYFAIRREVGPLDVSLRASTAGDSAWRQLETESVSKRARSRTLATIQRAQPAHESASDHF